MPFSVEYAMFIPSVGSRNSQYGYPPSLTPEPAIMTIEASPTTPSPISVFPFLFRFSLISINNHTQEVKITRTSLMRTYAVPSRNVKLAKESPMSYLKHFSRPPREILRVLPEMTTKEQRSLYAIFAANF